MTYRIEGRIYMYRRSEAAKRAIASEYNRRLESGAYVGQHSYLSPKGGYVLYHSGHNYHPEKVEATRHLANHGYRVELQPEGMVMWASAWKNENPRYSEGVVEGTLYDQKTVSQSTTNPSGNFRNALNHAVEKNAKIALVYDPHDKLHRRDVRTGMKEFMRYPRNRGKLDSVLIVTSSGRLYIHKLK